MLKCILSLLSYYRNIVSGQVIFNRMGSATVQLVTRASGRESGWPF